MASSVSIFPTNQLFYNNQGGFFTFVNGALYYASSADPASAPPLSLPAALVVAPVTSLPDPSAAPSLPSMAAAANPSPPPIAATPLAVAPPPPLDSSSYGFFYDASAVASSGVVPQFISADNPCFLIANLPSQTAPPPTTAYDSAMAASSAYMTSGAIVPLPTVASSQQDLQIAGWSVAPQSLASSWQQQGAPAALVPLEPPMINVNKRSNEEALLSANDLSKRPRVEDVAGLPLYPQRAEEKDCTFYMKTGTCSFGANCKFHHPIWVPAGGIPDWKEVPTLLTDSGPLPVRPGEPDCVFYMKTGCCKYGKKCRFNHPAVPEKKATEQTETFNQNAKGIFTGNSVAPANNQMPEGGNVKSTAGKPAFCFNSKGLPIRTGEADCGYYMRTGSCKYGSTCRFNHPERIAVSSEQAQQTMYPMFGSLPGVVGHPSPYQTGLPELLIDTTGTGLGLQSLSVASGLQAYPQRPGEQECAFYMKTGHCKFATTCKYHHPLNTCYTDGVQLTLAGLPRHEGEPVCSYYMKTGACKFGPGCKYDHPPPGEAAAKALAEVTKEALFASNVDQVATNLATKESN